MNLLITLYTRCNTLFLIIKISICEKNNFFNIMWFDKFDKFLICQIVCRINLPF